MDPRPQRRRMTVTHYSDDNPSTFTVKRKRGESFQPPPVRGKVHSPPVTTTTTTTTRKRKLRVIPEAPPQVQDTVVPHAVSIEPILPLDLLDTTTTASAACDALQNLPLIPPKPEWTKVPSAYTGVLLQRRFGSSVVEVPPPAVSCWAPQQPAGEHVAVGDVAGGVTVYRLHCRTLPIARLLTAAWKREQERILDSRKTISYPYAVQQVAWRAKTIVLQTALELELFVISNGKWNELAVRTVPLDTTKVGLWPGKLDVWTTSKKHHHVLWANGGRQIDPSVELKDYSHSSIVNTERVNGEKYTNGANGKSKAIRSATRVNGKVSVLTDDTAEENVFAKQKDNASAPKVAIEIETNQEEDQAGNSLLRVCIETDDENDREESILSVNPIQPTEIVSWTVLTAIWDASRAKNMEKDPTLLAVAWTSPETVEVVRCNAQNGEVAERTEGWQLSPSTNMLAAVTSTYCHIQQCSRFTLLAGCFKGIKVLDTLTLACVQTIGESVSLHGKTVQWQSFEYIRRPKNIEKGEIIRRQKKQEWIERFDEVSRRYADEPEDDSNDDDYWLVGVPYPYKGPEEMKSTLHVWKRGIPNPITTLQAPAGGCIGFSAKCDRISGGWKLICATAEFGEIWELKSSIVSDFAGVMYPVGYQAVDDNIEYIEDEDELDLLAISENVEETEKVSPNKEFRGRGDGNNDHDEDLIRALELSLQEQKQKARDCSSRVDQDVTINVLDEDSPSQADLIPCNPDMDLIRNTADHQLVPKSPIASPQKKDGFDSEVHLELPQTKQVRQKFTRLKQQQEALAQSSTVMANASSLSLPPRVKGKRTKIANVELLLQSCVNPRLRIFMGQRQANWSSGGGCRVFKPGEKNKRVKRTVARRLTEEALEENNRPSEEKELAMELLFLCPDRLGTLSVDTSQDSVSAIKLNDAGEVQPEQFSATRQAYACGACKGRMAIHVCGRRAMPIDYEAIERAEREQREREAEERNKQRVEKRRAADARRREERKKKKDEEARMRFEEEQKRREEIARMQQLEADQFEEAHIREHEKETGVVHVESSLTPLKDTTYRPNTMQSSSFGSANCESEHENLNSHVQTYSRFEESEGYSSQRSFDFRHQESFPSEGHASISSTRLETIRIDGAEVKPSQTISGEDALAALAGLADSMTAVVSTEESAPDYGSATSHHNNGSYSAAPASWYTREGENSYHAHSDSINRTIASSGPVEPAYSYQGSQDRRTAIAQAFLGTFCAGGNVNSYAFQGTVPVNSINYNEPEMNCSSNDVSQNGNKEYQGEEGNIPTTSSTWKKYHG